MELPSELFAYVNKVDFDEEYLCAEATTDEVAQDMSPGETRVVGIYKLVEKKTIAVVASLT